MRKSLLIVPAALGALLLGNTLITESGASKEDPKTAETAGTARQTAKVQPVGRVVSADGSARPHAKSDPFRGLTRRVSREQLGPIRSVRPRHAAAKADPKLRKQIVVKIITSPGGARVYRGRRRLGIAPLTLRVPENSTPLDLIIRAKGFMTLRTRIARSVTRTYAFKLTPSKGL